MKIVLNKFSENGFTLIEVILAIGIAAIVLVTVASVFFSAIRMRNATQAAVDNATPVDQALTFIRRDLQCVVTPTNGTTKVMSGAFRAGLVSSSASGEPVAVEMTTSTAQLNGSQPWGDLQRVTYELRDPANKNGQGKDLVRSVTRNILAVTTPQVDDQWMMSGIQSVTFSCYDGAQWWNTWDTTGLTSANTNLPVAVKVDIQPVGNQMAPYEIIVPIDSVARTNATMTTTTTQ